MSSVGVKFGVGAMMAVAAAIVLNPKAWSQKTQVEVLDKTLVRAFILFVIVYGAMFGLLYAYDAYAA